mgnify:CR=1 FL=1
MKYIDNKAEDVKIAYIGGGSRGWAWGLMSDLATAGDMSGRVELYDIDFEAAKANETIGNKYNNLPEATSKWEYKAVETIGEALTGADFVIISILPGTFDEMESDVHAPEEYGIYQSVGDTTGTGGVVRALRTLPMFEEIAENIKKYSPDAWVINYTNPMTLCVKTLYRVFPEIKAFGCCHEVFGTQDILAKMASVLFGDFFSRKGETETIFADGWIISAGKETIKAYKEGEIAKYSLKNLLTDTGKGDLLARKATSASVYFSFSEERSALKDLFTPSFLKLLTPLIEEAEVAPAVLSISKDKIGMGLDFEMFALSLQKSNEAVFERDTTVVVPSGPFKVKNSGTGKMNEFYQNSHKSLCLREDGKDLWGIPFDKLICGRAGTVWNTSLAWSSSVRRNASGSAAATAVICSSI